MTWPCPPAIPLALGGADPLLLLECALAVTLRDWRRAQTAELNARLHRLLSDLSTYVTEAKWLLELDRARSKCERLVNELQPEATVRKPK